MFRAVRLTRCSAARAIVPPSSSLPTLPIGKTVILASASVFYGGGMSRAGPSFWATEYHPSVRSGRGFMTSNVRQQLKRKNHKSSTAAESTTSDEPASTRPDPQSPTPTVHIDQLTAQDPTLREDIYTLPNVLTLTRLIAAPAIGYLVLYDHNAWAVGLFFYAGVTDALDGWIARKWNSKTVVGTVIDPMADKALMTSLTVCLAIKGSMPLWLAAIILGRDIGLAIAAVYYRWISLPPPKTFARYWDFSLPSAEVRPTTISKYNTFLQLALVGITTVMPLIEGLGDFGLYLQALQYIVAATTIWSGLSYVYSKDAVKILKQANKTK